MTRAKIELENAPAWVQNLIIDTALGLLEDEFAYCEKWGEEYYIYAHGYKYTAIKSVKWII